MLPGDAWEFITCKWITIKCCKHPVGAIFLSSNSDDDDDHHQEYECDDDDEDDEEEMMITEDDMDESECIWNKLFSIELHSLKRGCCSLITINWA